MDEVDALVRDYVRAHLDPAMYGSFALTEHKHALHIAKDRNRGKDHAMEILLRAREALMPGALVSYDRRGELVASIDDPIGVVTKICDDNTVCVAIDDARVHEIELFDHVTGARVELDPDPQVDRVLVARPKKQQHARQRHTEHLPADSVVIGRDCKAYVAPEGWGWALGSSTCFAPEDENTHATARVNDQGNVWISCRWGDTNTPTYDDVDVEDCLGALYDAVIVLQHNFCEQGPIVLDDYPLVDVVNWAISEDNSFSVQLFEAFYPGAVESAPGRTIEDFSPEYRTVDLCYDDQSGEEFALSPAQLAAWHAKQKKGTK